jgi:hypothetical protein
MLRKSLAEGFFMNSARRISNNEEGSYITVNETSLAKVDRQSNLAICGNYPDWILYTEISENGNSNFDIYQ